MENLDILIENNYQLLHNKEKERDTMGNKIEAIVKILKLIANENNENSDVLFMLANELDDIAYEIANESGDCE